MTPLPLTTPMLTLAQAAAEIGVSKRWLQYWLAEHPVGDA